MDDKEAAEVAKALGNPLRLGFLRALRTRGRLSAVEYSRESGERLPNVSYHVQALHQACVIEVVEQVQRRGALEHRYALREPRAALLLALMDRLAEA